MESTPMKAKEVIMFLLNIPEEQKDKLFTLKEWHPKRSRSQNSYYWQLLGQLAKALKMSTTELHNLMLRDFGQLELFNGEPAITMLPDTGETEKKVLKMEACHLKPSSKCRPGKGGINYRAYYLLKGSSELNTAEMAYLLNGLIEECKQQGIETLTPDELARMRLEEEKRNEHKAQRQAYRI